MVTSIFDTDALDKWQTEFENALLRREFPKDTDDEYFDILRERARYMPQPIAGSNITNRLANTVNISSAFSDPVAARQDVSPGSPSTLVAPEPEYEREAWGSAVADTWRADKQMNLKSRRAAMFGMTRLQSGDENIKAWAQRKMHRKDELLSVDEATMLARDLGSDMKFDKPVSQYYVEQAVRFDLRDKALKNVLADESQIGSLGRWNDATVLASGMAGGIGPGEAIVGVLGGWILPEVGAAALAKTGTLVQNGLKIKKVEDAAKTINTLKTLNNVAKSATGTMAERQAVSAVIKNYGSIDKVIKAEERIMKAAQVLENISGIRYANLGNAGKTGLDVIATTITDLPFINASRATSEELGLDIYTEQDKMADSFFAFGLGAFLPTGVRAIGRKMGIVPHALLLKKCDDIERDLVAKNALGEISDADLAKGRAAIKDIRESIPETSKIYKQPHEMQYEMADSLAKINMTQEQAVTYLRYVSDQIMQGNVPKMRELPEFQSLMSHIDARIVRQLEHKSITEVFGKAIIREVTPSGLQRVFVNGEDGVLGQRAITGLTPEESIERMEQMYKAFVLDDVKASKEFKEWADRFSELTRKLEDIQASDAENIRLNAAARKVGEKPPVPVSEQINKRRELEAAYMTYRLGREQYAEDLSISTNNMYMDALGEGVPEPHSKEYDEALEDFEEFYNKYTKVNEKGYVEFSDEFSDFVQDLKAAAQDNAYMADVDNTLINIGEEKLKTVINKMQELDVSADTTDTLLFGVPRITFDDLQKLDGDVADMDSRLALARIDYNKMKSSGELSDAFNTLQNYSVINKDFKSVFDIAVRKIDKIKELRTSKYVELEQDLLDKMHSNKDFQMALQSLDFSEEHAAKRSMRSLRNALRSTLTSIIEKSSVGEMMSTRDVSRITRYVLDNVVPEIENNPKMVEAFMDAESLDALYKVSKTEADAEGAAAKLSNEVDGPSPEALNERTIEAATNATVSWNAFMEPIRKNLDYVLANIELQEINNVRVSVNKMTLMKANPAWAAEVVTGAATQTQYGYMGARRSIEYQSKSVGFYINSLGNQLRKMKTTDGGQNLLDWSKAIENKDAIQEALIRKAHGEPYTANDNAGRVADLIANQESSFRVRFRNFGSDHPGMGSPIKRSKLKYADTAVSDTDAQSVYDNMSTAFNIDSQDVLRAIERDDNGALRNGYQWLDSEDRANILIKNSIKDMQETAQDFVEIGDETHRKLATWAFRDFDLDAMFDKDATAPISLNAIRDAILNGSLAELVDGDIQNLKYVASGFKRIKTALMGAKLKDVGGIKHAGGFCYKFRSGLYNLRAAAQGERSAAVESLGDVIRFKDADSEILAASKFGYDTIDEYVQTSYENIFNAFFAMQEFGTNPREMARMLVDTYNRAIERDTGFQKKLLKMAGDVGRKDPYKALADKFGITEGAASSIDDNVAYGAGLHNMTPSTPARLIKSIKTFLSASLLMKAGLKSYSDYSTIFSGLLVNGMAEGRGEALQAISKAVIVMRQNKELEPLFLGASQVQADMMLRKMNNDPTTDVVKLSRDYNLLDKIEAGAHWWGNMVMNNMGRMSAITDSNKATAAWAMSLAIGKKADASYADLNPNLQMSLLKEGFDAQDWDFIRKYCVVDYADEINKELGYEAISPRNSFKMFVPQKALHIPDDVWVAEMQKRGELNIIDSNLTQYKDDMFTRLWTMIDAGADELVSIPSGRVETWMHMGKARNSGMGIAAEILTQYNSFPAALAYNLYFKYLAGFASRETGISVIDLFNPHVKLAHATRPKIFWGLGGLLFNVAATMLVVDSLVNATAGQIQIPVGSDGKVHADSYRTSLVGALGTFGTLLNAVIEGVDGSGQRGGGFSLQVAPSISNMLRTGYRLSKPLRSEKIEAKDKPAALLAGTGQEIARATGIRSMPFVGLFWQAFFGARLDMMYSGGPRGYRAQQKQRQRRGYVLMPWEQDPDWVYKTILQ